MFGHVYFLEKIVLTDLTDFGLNSVVFVLRVCYYYSLYCFSYAVHCVCVFVGTMFEVNDAGLGIVC